MSDPSNPSDAAKAADASVTASTNMTEIVANRRTVLRTATGLVAAAAVGGMFLTGTGEVAAQEGESESESNDEVTAEQDTSPDAATDPTRTSAKFDVFKSAFNVLSVRAGVSNPYHVGSAGVERGGFAFSDITLTKQMDLWTPLLQQAAAAGTTFNDVVITVNRGSAVVSRYVIKNVGVTSSMVAFPGVSTPLELVETITLAFTRITYSFGSQSYSWDLTPHGV